MSQQVLITPHELLRTPADERPLILDVRWTLQGPDEEAYRNGHIPGAVFCNLDAHLAGPAGSGGRHPLPARDILVKTLSMWGVSQDTPVVVYDDSASLAASRAWWCLRWVGCTDVRILDGGWGAWREAGGEVVDGVEVTGEAVEPWTSEASMPWVEAEDLDPEHAIVVDVRTAERFRGEVEPIDPIAGHIPGAINIPIGEVLTADGAFRPQDDLRPHFHGKNLHRTAVVAYCGSGVTASQFVAAAAICDITVALYPGSWSEWITDPDRKIATGE